MLERAIACAGASPSFRELPIHLGARRAPTSSRPPAVDVSVPFSDAKVQLVDAFERAYLTELLRATEGNVTEASRRSGLNRRHMYDLLKKHGIRA